MNKIEHSVKQLIKKYGSADPFYICEKMGIITVDRDLPWTYYIARNNKYSTAES